MRAVSPDCVSLIKMFAKAALLHTAGAMILKVESARSQNRGSCWHQLYLLGEWCHTSSIVWHSCDKTLSFKNFCLIQPHLYFADTGSWLSIEDLLYNKLKYPLHRIFENKSFHLWHCLNLRLFLAWIWRLHVYDGRHTWYENSQFFSIFFWRGT